MRRIAGELFGKNGKPPEVPQLHSVLIALLLAYREAKLYREMVEVYDRFPAELKATPVALEQYALALNRLAEAAAGKDLTEGARLRREALRAVERMTEAERTSETWGIIGRVHKGNFDALSAAGRGSEARAALGRAIEAYERGFRVDTRDYYPGVNAVTLRFRRDTQEDREKLSKLLPAVQFAIERAPEPNTADERYWQTATKLELALVASDHDAADEILSALVGLEDSAWKYETTMKNVRILTSNGTRTEAVERVLRELEQKAAPASA